MQSFPTSAQVIHDTLTADATFAATLGTYSFPDASTYPAISVVTPGERLPHLSDVAGVECVILDVPNIRRRNYVTDNADLVKLWRLFVIAWEPANGSDVEASVSRIIQIFSGASSFETVQTSEGLNAKVQTVVTIPSNSPILI
jgi:hypothetical protein